MVRFRWFRANTIRLGASRARACWSTAPGVVAFGMSIRATGRVVGGHLRVDIPVELAENTEVQLAEVEDADAADAGPELEAALAEGAEQIARGEGSSWEDVRARLRMKGRDEALPGTGQPQG